VKVELDGAPWRTVSVDVVLAAGLHVGLVLDRERLRVVRRELRSREALSLASRLLSRRDLTEQGLGEELQRRRVAPAARRDTISRLVNAGAVDDERLASRRAEVLAARGGGDALIRADLESRGVDPLVISRAIEALEREEDRARSIVGARGVGPATARYLARKGFGEESLAAAFGGAIAESA
jgi:SOS response regulatory protein OraA/RecX